MAAQVKGDYGKVVPEALDIACFGPVLARAASTV
jgi:hypothetical protein